MIGRVPKLALAFVTVIVVAGLAVAAFAAFGGGSSSTTTTNGPFDQAAMQQFQQCMSQHGVQAPQPGQGRPSGGFSPSKKMQQAIQACRQYAPQLQGAPPDGAPQGGGFPGAPSG
jgi:hypothetical protein